MGSHIKLKHDMTGFVFDKSIYVFTPTIDTFFRLFKFCDFCLVNPACLGIGLSSFRIGNDCQVVVNRKRYLVNVMNPCQEFRDNFDELAVEGEQ